ncbi:unnamed protein product [Parnassius mnemosyne]|uniref:PiggyBac transposable element-derived protein domain-containing protein n=1 Tax=Parnassius mnemosyne TaxID=213953 RepID=A0AAV1L0S0_9NEOP
MDPNSGSEVEPDEDVEEDISLRPLLNPSNVVAEDINELKLTEASELMRLDAEEDQAIRTIAAGEVDVLYFDWCADIKNFEGVREEFTGSSGPTFDHSGLSPLQVFEEIWDTNIIDLIVTETNRYANNLKSKRSGKLTSRMKRWKDVDREEMWQFLTILLLQSVVVNNVEREYWYPSNEQMRIGDFGKIMP